MQQEILQSLANLRAEIDRLTQLLSNEPPQNSEFKELVRLVNSHEWPTAVDTALLCTSEEDKIERAKLILMVNVSKNLENLKFLDFGCGEGHVAKTSNAKFSVGYDVVKDDQWENTENVLFTDSIRQAQDVGPYDVILAHDVLDHMENTTTMREKLTQMKYMLAPGGIICLRMHPWLSRHGTHLYRQINKAYVHVIFTEEEIAEMGWQETPTVKILHWWEEYRKLFKECSLNIVTERQENTPVEPFFRNNAIVRKRFIRHWAGSWDGNLREGNKIQDIAFATYTLS